MKNHNWLVIMQKSDKSINSGIRLSDIFLDRKTAERYASEKEKSDTEYDKVSVVPRIEREHLAECMKASESQ